jgi:CheY-like chemotaxis protein
MSPPHDLAVRLTVLHGTLNVLIVEDRPENLELLAETFRMCCLFRVQTAGSAQRAIQVIDKGEWGGVDFLLLDLGLPDVDDGFSVLRHCGSKLPVYVVTGRDSPAEAGVAAKLGAMEILEKPVVDTPALIRAAFGLALRHRLERFAGPDAFRHRAVDHLFERKPPKVAQWVAGQQVNESYHRRKWEEVGVRAKDVLRVFRLYCIGFEYLCCEQHKHSATPALRDELVELLDFLDTHRTALMPLVRPPAVA